MTRYEVIERIGAGRVAEIFRGKATAAGGFEKPVAIKRILPHLSKDPRFVELLIAEAKLMSVLRHRNIVQIFDVGVGDDGEHFLVMEYVDGVDVGALQRHLEASRQRLPIDLVLHLGAEVCEALDHAQQAPDPDGRPMRLVHRDVTPSNVMVSKAGEIKLTDFGLAKRHDDGTSAGGLRGRYGYVSPEQASGQPIDARTDVFAVGVIMWELALGRRLWSNLADFDALRAVKEGKVARVRDLDPALPEALDLILAEALARDPARRLPNAGELGKRLRGLRYSLDDSSGDPAGALARLVARVDRGKVATPVEAPTTAARGKDRSKRPSVGFDASEPTVLRIRTADGFAEDHTGTNLLAARAVIDRFEDEETRMARLPAAFADVPTTRTDRDSLEVPTGGAPLHLPRDSGELTAPAPPLDVEPPRQRPRLRAPSQAEPPPVPPRAPPRPAAAPAPAAPPPAAAPPAPPPRGTEPMAAAPPPGYPPPPRPPAPRPLTAPAYGRAPTRAPSLGVPAGATRRRWAIIGAGAVVVATLSFFITRAALQPPELAHPSAAPVVDAGAEPTADAGKAARAVPIDAAVPVDAPPLDAAVPGDAAPADDATTGDGATTADDAAVADAPMVDAGATVDAAPKPAAPPRRHPPARPKPRKRRR